MEIRSLLAGITGGPPSVVLTKGIVASTDPTATYDIPTGPSTVTFGEPGTTDHPFSGTISSNLIRTGPLPRPLNANLTNANPGDKVRIAVLLENQAIDGTAFDVSLRDTLATGVSYVPNSLRVVDGTGSPLTFQDLAGAADGSGLFTTGIQLDDPGATDGSFANPIHCGALDALTANNAGRNIAIAFYDVTVSNLPGGTPVFTSDATLANYSQTEGGTNLSTSATASASVSLERIDLEVSKSVSNPAPLAGDVVTWTIEVTNDIANATSSASGVIVRDTIPSGQTVLPGSAVFPAGGSFDEASGVWTVGQLIVPGGAAQLTFQTIAGNSVAFATPLVDVEVSGTIAITTVTEGGSVDYTVTVTNNAEVATTSATGIVISDLIPAGLSYVTHAAANGSFTPGTGIWDLSTVTLAPGQSTTLNISTLAAAGTAGTSVGIGAELTALTQTDADSTANNGAGSEDDDFTQTVTVLAAATTRTISGKVFLDADNNGTIGAESGVQNVTVNAYSPDGTLTGTAISSATGDYTITGITTEAVRLEFIGFSRTQSVTTAQSPPAGVSTFSSLAFLDAGAANLTANLAMYQPTTQALFVTTCFVYSGQSTLDPTIEPAIVAFNADGSIKNALATIAQIGATNGLAVHSFSGDQFVAAFQKRHADIGPSGNSAIYRIDESTGVVSTFIRLDDFFGADSTGVYSHNPLDWFTDAPAFATVGASSLGDVDISEDGQFLYTINLATRQLIEIPIGSGGTNAPVDYAAGDTRTIRTFPILGNDTNFPTNGGIPTGQLGADPANNIRPFALSVKDGIIYVGMVNSALSTANDADMFAYVYAFNPATGQFSTTASTAFNLDTRTLGGGWQSWTNTWADLPKFYEAAGDYFTVGRNQPWLTDIEFDNNGDMILGFRDRTGDQVGHMVGDPTGTDSDTNGSIDRFYHDTKGDILHLRKTGDAVWTVETSHTAGDNTEYYVGDAAEFDPLASTLHPEAAQGGLTQISGFNDVVTTAIDPQSFWAGGALWLDNATGAQKDQLDLFSGSELADIVNFGKNNGLGDLEYLNNLSMEIGNRVWNDVDRDGVQDAGEAALANVDIQLFDVSNPLSPLLVGSVTTDAAGEYYFNDSNVAYADGGDPIGLRALTNYEARVAATEFQTTGTLDRFHITRSNQSPILAGRTVQTVTGSAAFDSNLDLVPDTARSQRIDVLTATGLSADGIRVMITNSTGGFARVDYDQTVVFEFSDGSLGGTFEYFIIDDRLDNDAAGFDDNGDGMTDRATIAFTSGAAGTTDHSLDFGFSEARVDLELTKLSERKLAVEGETVTFLITLTNNEARAETAATGVTVADIIPAGLTFLPASVTASQGTFDGTTWTLPNALSPGDIATLRYQTTVDTGTAGNVLMNSAQVVTLNETDVDSIINNDDGDRSEDDEDDAALLIGTLTNTTTINFAQVMSANEPDFDSTPDDDDHDQSEDDEGTAAYTLSTSANVFDFGDLPDTYLTLSASGGPSHRRGTSTFLGTSIDDEPDGQPSPTGIGDGPDEDGIRFLTPLLPSTSASIEVVASTNGFLNAWIDFNSDGVLDEISVTTIDGVPVGTPVAAADLALTAGIHTLAIAVPASATGLMAARFRYTNDQMAALRAPGGPWLNGEVEDYLLRQIGDRVWFDHDADGVFDAGSEAGLAGVTVVLSADLDGDGTTETYPTVTDANGFYRYDGLPAGTYTVSVSPPASLTATFDIDGGMDSTAVVTLTPTTTQRLDVDFGYRGVALIGDTVWIDSNANGTTDTGESGISGVSVQLTGDLNGDSVTDVTLNTTTNATGLYEFQNLVAGNYTVTVAPPVDLLPTFDADSTGTPNTSNTSLSIATVNRAQDFGYRGSGLIGDTVWLDLNGDGVQDTGEPGIAGVAVQLTGDTNGDSVTDVTLTTTTNASGVYEFPNLLAGTYTVTVTPPVGSSQTFDADGTTTPSTSTVTLAAAGTNRDQDFGYQTTTGGGGTGGLIGDTVWLDTDGDGTQDAGEPGIGGVAVQLSGDTNGDSVIDVTLNTTTNASGTYEFTNLNAGTYNITVTPPSGLTQTFDADGTATADTSSLTLIAGATDQAQDFGYRGSAVLGDTVWFDADLDGIQDTGESGISGISVQLVGDLNGDSVNDINLNTLTNAIGIYEFTNLAPGSYAITVTPPSGSVPTFDADGTSSPHTSTIAIAAGATDRAQDFGYAGTATVGDLIFSDVDNSSSFTTGDTGISAVELQLDLDVNGDGTVDFTATDTTDTNGLYSFTNLLPGTFAVTVNPATLTGATSPVFDPDGSNDGTSSGALTPGATDLTRDFGYAGSTTTPTGVDLIISKDNITANDAAAVGSIVTYTIVVSNAGPANATTATVTDTLPAEFVSATWTAAGSIGATFATSGSGNIAESVSLPAGASITYTIAAQLNSTFTGTITNTATVTTTLTETNLTNNSSSDVTSVTPLTLTPNSPALPGQPFEISSSGMSHVALVPFIVGTTPGPGTVNGVPVDIADPEVFMIGFVCVDDRIIAVYDIPENLDGQTLYFQSYEATPTPRLSNVVQAQVGAARIIVTESGGISSVTEGSTTDTLSIKLSQPPTANVVVNVQNQSPARLSTTPATLTFTPTNWNVSQSVNLQAVNDTDPNGDVTATVSISVQAGSDAAFVTGFEQSIEVSVSDNDVLQRPGLNNSFTQTESQQPTITWSHVAGAESYDLWISPTTNTASPVYDINVVGTSFTPSSPLGIGRFNIWVRARTAAGEVSAWSVGARVDVATKPVVNAIADGTNRRPSFAWSSVSAAKRYEVWVNNQTTGASKVAHSTIITGTSFSPTAELGFGTHAVWVRAIDQHNFAGQWSAAESFSVVPELQSPIRPTFSNQPTFTWSTLPGAATFEIYLQSGSTVTRQAGLTTASWTPPTTLPEGVHRWWVRGFAANGKAGKWSAPAETTIGGRPSITTPAPSGTTSTTAAAFAWTAVDGATGYSLYVGRVDVQGLAFRDDTLSTTSYSHTAGLAAGTYRVWARAISSAGTRSSWSAPVTFTVAHADAVDETDTEFSEVTAAVTAKVTSEASSKVTRKQTSAGRVSPVVGITPDHSGNNYSSADELRIKQGLPAQRTPTAQLCSTNLPSENSIPTCASPMRSQASAPNDS